MHTKSEYKDRLTQVVSGPLSITYEDMLMGCDIHLYTETLNRKTERWEPENKWEGREDGTLRMDWAHDELSVGRNYDLFAILANVRNGKGFAGIDTGDGFNPIAMPRGLPPDVSDLVRSEAAYWRSDGHSHSWFTLAELAAYDWKQQTKHRCYVDFPTYSEWVFGGRKGFPRSSCGDVSGGGIKKITDAQVAELGGIEGIVDSNTENERQNLYVRIEFGIKYGECCYEFLTEFIPKLQKITAAKGLTDDEIRIVFFFDN